MARAHGFRVFIVEAYPNRIKDNDPVDASAGSSLHREIRLLLTRLQRGGTVQFPPRAKPDGSESAAPTRTATITFVEDVGPSAIHVVIAIGERGSHAHATKPNEAPQDIKEWSPEAEHNVTFLFPDGQDSRFLLVTETVKRVDPLQRLKKMLTTESMKRREELKAEDQQARDEARSVGGTMLPPVDRKRLLFDPSQALDEIYLDEIVADADSAIVEFQGYHIDARGNHGPIERTLQIKLRDQNIFDVGRTIARRWSRRWREGNKISSEDAVSELSDLLEDQDLIEAEEEERYSNAKIKIRSKSEASTTIAADAMRETFTYSISDYRPGIRQFYDQVTVRVRSIARQYSIEIPEIDPEEAVQCLKGLTPDPS